MIAIDECIRMAALIAGKQICKRRDYTKVIVYDNDPVFRSKLLDQWATSRDIKIHFAAPYHPEADDLAERLIRDLKQYPSMNPKLVGFGNAPQNQWWPIITGHISQP